MFCRRFYYFLFYCFQQEDKLAKEQQKEKEQDGEKKEEESPKPNPALQQGMPLPQKMSDFPPEMFGIPIEDIDEYYHNKYVREFYWFF